MKSILAIWSILTLLPLLLHRSRWLGRLTALDPLGLIPHWKMFSGGAPGLSSFDYDIVYRDRCADGSLTDWQSLEPPRKATLRFLFNPGLIRRITVYHYAWSLIRQAADWRTPPERFRDRHERLAEAILHRPPLAPDSRERMFSLVCRDMSEEGAEEAPATFDSNWYAL